MWGFFPLHNQLAEQTNMSKQANQKAINLAQNAAENAATQQQNAKQAANQKGNKKALVDQNQERAQQTQG